MSSENKGTYYHACPYCLTEIGETPKDEEKRQTHRAKAIEKAKAQPMETKPTEQLSSMKHKCPHHFGYLSQRSRGEEIPEECMICEKIVECMLSKLKIPTVHKQLEQIHVASLKSNSSAPEIDSEIPVIKEVIESAEESAKETVKIELKENLEPGIKIDPLPAEASGNQFIVENVGMLYASWSGTVLIDRETLWGWGRKIKEVEIENLNGKRTRCKVKPMEGSKKGIIRIPDKMQLNLEIRKGELVRVKPVIELQKKS